MATSAAVSARGNCLLASSGKDFNKVEKGIVTLPFASWELINSNGSSIVAPGLLASAFGSDGCSSEGRFLMIGASATRTVFGTSEPLRAAPPKGAFSGFSGLGTGWVSPSNCCAGKGGNRSETLAGSRVSAEVGVLDSEGVVAVGFVFCSPESAGRDLSQAGRLNSRVR